MVEGMYYFGDQLRWSLGWPNPNPAGAFIATLIPFFWWLQHWLRGRSWIVRRLQLWSAQMLVLALELVLWLLLIKTYSRGGLVAICLAALFWWLVRRRCCECLLPAIRIFAITTLLLTTGAVWRIEPNYLVEDYSVINRADLWSGGIKMLALRPLTGWGKGESGQHYMHWLQDIDATEKYAGMVNSYLHLAVERGVLSLWPWLFTLCWIVLMSLFLTGNEDLKESACTLLAAAVSSLLTFGVANFFSTLWVFPNLWWTPGACVGLAIVMVICMAWNNARCRSLVVYSAFAAVIIVTALLSMLVIFGKVWLRKDSLSMHDEVVYLGGGAMERHWWIFADPAVFGLDYGKELRRLAQVLNSQGICLVVPLKPSAKSVPEAETILLSGSFSIYWPEFIDSGARLVLVHPTGEAPAPTGQFESAVILLSPMIDPKRRGSAWQQLAADLQWPIESSGAIGIDVRPVWPAMLQDVGIIDP